MAASETPGSVDCSDHPGHPLTPAYGALSTNVRGKAMQCLQAGHVWWARRRCARCGDVVLSRYQGGRISRTYRAIYCSGRCRLVAWREIQAARL